MVGLQHNPGHNADGDEEAMSFGFTEVAGRTYYDEGEQLALRVVPVIGDALETSGLVDVLAWKKAGQLGPHQPVDRVGILAQSREAAPQAVSEAKPKGVDLFTYSTTSTTKALGGTQTLQVCG